MRAHENPFRADRIEQLPFQFETIDQTGLLNHLRVRSGGSAIVGPQGSGKTTLLELLYHQMIESNIPAALFTFEHARSADLRRLFRQIGDLPPQTTLFVDGADVLSPMRWRFLKILCRLHRFGLVITSHRSGMLPTLVENQTSPTLLQSLLAELLPNHHIEELTDQIEPLFHRHDGNIRHCFRELYDQFSAKPTL